MHACICWQPLVLSVLFGLFRAVWMMGAARCSPSGLQGVPLLDWLVSCACARRYDFLAREQEVACLRELTPEELQQAYAEYFAPASPQRRKLAIHVVGKSHAGELAAAVPAGVQLAEDLPGLQGRLGAFPAMPGTPPPVATVEG